MCCIYDTFDVVSNVNMDFVNDYNNDANFNNDNNINVSYDVTWAAFPMPLTVFMTDGTTLCMPKSSLG